MTAVAYTVRQREAARGTHLCSGVQGNAIGVDDEERAAAESAAAEKVAAEKEAHEAGQARRHRGLRRAEADLSFK